MSEPDWYSIESRLPHHGKPVQTWHPDHGYAVMSFTPAFSHPFQHEDIWIVCGNIEKAAKPAAAPKEWCELPPEPR